MVFVKFHNMNRKKNFLMSSLNSSSKFFSLYNKSKQYYSHSSQMFSFLFFFFSIYVLMFILLKMSVLSFFPYMLCSTMFKFLFFFFSFRLFSIVLYVFVFCFHHFFFIINCSFNVSFFSNLISTSLCPYLNSITIGSLPSLFNISL